METARRFYQSYIHSYMRLFLLAVILGAIASSVEPALLFYGGDYFTKIIKNEDKIALLKLLPLALFTLMLIQSVSRWLNDLIVRYVSEKCIFQIRNQVFNHCMGLSLKEHFNNKSGTLLSRITYDITIISVALGSMTALIREPFTILGLLVVAFIRNWKLTVIALVSLPICIIAIQYIGKLIKRYTYRVQDRFADINQTLQESFYGIQMIQGYNLGKKIKEKFAATNQNFFKARVKSMNVEVLSTPIITCAATTFACVVLYFLINHTNSLDLKIENFRDVGTIFIALGLLLSPIKKLNIVNIDFQKALAAADRVFQVLDTQPSIQNSSRPIGLKHFSNQIVFKNVRFKYEEEEVLKNINLTIKKGESLALVGGSGAGKTTVVHLLPRFYDVTSGSIEVDGHDIRLYDLEALRTQMAFVSQEVILFNETIEENIRYGQPHASFTDIEKAARAAYAHDFIMQCREGYQTVIGDRGVKLSGGQRQRLSIARAILRNAPIIILDEATSSLDTESERIVQEALRELLKERTSIIIAHRLSTIENVDRVVVLEKGQIIEAGSPGELFEKKGQYFNLYAMSQRLLQ